MNRGFIFDMEGVIVNTEPVWPKYEEELIDSFAAIGIYKKIKKDILGKSIEQIAELLKQEGYIVDKQKFYKNYDAIAIKVFAEAKFTERIEELIKLLQSMQFKLGLVSAARQPWIDLVLKRLKLTNVFEIIVSVNNSLLLKPKPYPDGYTFAMQEMNITPNNSIILEDSNTGIKAAKASGALTICLKENLDADYKSEGADIYIEDLTDLLRFIKIISKL